MALMILTVSTAKRRDLAGKNEFTDVSITRILQTDTLVTESHTFDDWMISYETWAPFISGPGNEEINLENKNIFKSIHEHVRHVLVNNSLIRFFPNWEAQEKILNPP